MEDKTNQPEKIPAPKVRKITPLDLLKRDVKLYRADCLMSVGNDKKCRPCTAAFFESILGMIDRIALQEAIARQERKTGKWVKDKYGTDHPVVAIISLRTILRLTIFITARIALTAVQSWR